MDLIAQLLLESRTGAYIGWLANELIMIANKTWPQGHAISNALSQIEENNKPYCLSYPLESGDYSH